MHSTIGWQRVSMVLWIIWQNMVINEPALLNLSLARFASSPSEWIICHPMRLIVFLSWKMATRLLSRVMRLEGTITKCYDPECKNCVLGSPSKLGNLVTACSQTALLC